MASSRAATVEQYLAELTADRRTAIAAVRAEILRNLLNGYEECTQYRMIAYLIPLPRYPQKYNDW